MSKFRNNIAMHCGVNAAVVAEHLWYLLVNEAAGEDAFSKGASTKTDSITPVGIPLLTTVRR